MNNNEEYAPADKSVQQSVDEAEYDRRLKHLLAQQERVRQLKTLRGNARKRGKMGMRA